jgi:uncharacterized membrane protein YdjX (TVP38/TMEM64 family)
MVPEMDEDGKPIKSDSKSAVALTAFVVAAGVVALRVGGRAALISAIGLDFATENPELKDNLDNILAIAESLDPLARGGLFLAAWTAVKVLCFDVGGVALALSSGILFGGVLQGAVISAFCATVGSSVAFAMAKLDTPVRKKALEVVDEYPSLRGIEKVVARDGFKAILTLRLAPVLPIPLGMYNYVYGVTNVPFLSFFSGIFLGSLKPYLLDSYLGYFGKTIVDGTAAAASEDASGMQDIILLVALGLSVLIGVFASQLAGETWETVLEEVEAEKREKEGDEQEPDQQDDGIVREFLNMQVPDWLVGFQISLAMADDRIHEMIDQEYDAHVWNYTTKVEQPIPRDLDPAFYPTSPEMLGANRGFDVGASVCDGLVLSPALLEAYFLYADPLLDEEKAKSKRREPRDFLMETKELSNNLSMLAAPIQERPNDSQEVLLDKLQDLRSITRERLNKLNERLSDEEL